MKQIRHSAILLIPAISLFLFAIAALPRMASAQVVETTDNSTIVASNDSNVTFYIGTTTAAMTLKTVSLWLNDDSGLGDSTTLRLTCFANTWSTSQSGCISTAAIESSNSYNVTYVSGGQRYDFAFNGAQLQGGKVYVAEVLTSAGVKIYGAPLLAFINQCTYAGTGTQDCTGAPYFVSNAGINWQLISFPLVYSTSSAGIATSSSMWNSLSFASTTAKCEGGNLFSDGLCAAAMYLFVPNPDVLNNFTLLASTTIPSKFPMSWFYGVKSTIAGLSASSTENMISVEIPFEGSIATTSAFGNILPNVTVLSSTTISTYLSDGIRNTILTLEAAAIWVLFALFLVRDIRHRFFHV